MAMGHVGGMAFELEEPEMRNARLRNLNTLFRNIADDNVNVCTHLIRHPDVPDLPQAAFRSGFAAGLDRTYRDRVLNGQAVPQRLLLLADRHPAQSPRQGRQQDRAVPQGPGVGWRRRRAADA